MKDLQNNHPEVNIYFRTCLKYAILSTFPKNVPPTDLYSRASHLYQLPSASLHLYSTGKLIQNKEGLKITLQQKQIIHVVNILGLNKQVIFITVRKIEGRLNTIKFQVSCNTRIKDFIDDKLFKVYGQTSNDLVLVNVGRRLQVQKTFRQEQVQNESQLICLNFRHKQTNSRETVGNQQTQVSKNQIFTKISLPQNQSSHLANKIYPMPNFVINVPQDLQDSNKLHLIYDSKIMHSSSINKSQMDPESIIEQQNSNSFLNFATKFSESKSQQDVRGDILLLRQQSKGSHEA